MPEDVARTRGADRLFPSADGVLGRSDADEPSEAEGLQRRIVAVIDDDAEVRESLTLLLEAHGFTPAGYASAATFLAGADHHDAACLIIDHHMSGMKGLDLLAALHREGHHPSALLITGRVDPGVAEQAARLGVHALLEKPFAAPRLIELVRAGLRDDG